MSNLSQLVFYQLKAESGVEQGNRRLVVECGQRRAHPVFEVFKISEYGGTVLVQL